GRRLRRALPHVRRGQRVVPTHQARGLASTVRARRRRVAPRRGKLSQALGLARKAARAVRSLPLRATLLPPAPPPYHEPRRAMPHALVAEHVATLARPRT